MHLRKRLLRTGALPFPVRLALAFRWSFLRGAHTSRPACLMAGGARGQHVCQHVDMLAIWPDGCLPLLLGECPDCLPGRCWADRSDISPEASLNRLLDGRSGRLLVECPTGVPTYRDACCQADVMALELTGPLPTWTVNLPAVGLIR